MSKTLNLQLLFVGKMRFFAIEIILRWVAMTSLPKISQPLPNISSYLNNWYDYGTWNLHTKMLNVLLAVLYRTRVIRTRGTITT